MGRTGDRPVDQGLLRISPQSNPRGRDTISGQCQAVDLEDCPYQRGRTVMNRARTDAPRTNREPGELERKRQLLTSPHVAPLTEHVQRMRAERGSDRVPDFDPTEAGTSAPILLLLEAPGPKATKERGGSGFASRQ